MKRLSTLCLGLLAALSLHAQEDFPLQFAYSDGTIVPGGTTLELSEAVEDDFGDIEVPTHLYVKNISGETIQGGGTYTIQSLSNGAFQTCFPITCVQQRSTGSFTTGSDAFAPGELKNMQTEWLPTGKGTALVTYQLLTFKQNVITKKWGKDKEGPTITLKFSYGVTPSGISHATSATSGDSRYTVSGMRLSGQKKGLTIVRSSDGTVRKVVR